MTKGNGTLLCAEWLSERLGLEDEDEVSAFHDWMRWGVADEEECASVVEKAWTLLIDANGASKWLH